MIKVSIKNKIPKKIEELIKEYFSSKQIEFVPRKTKIPLNMPSYGWEEVNEVSDLPEILDGYGLIVEPSNVTELSDKISFLFENEDIAIRLGENARKKCIEKYSWDAMEKILTGVFSKYE